MSENKEVVTEEVTESTEEQFNIDSFVDSIIQLSKDLEQSFEKDKYLYKNGCSKVIKFWFKTCRIRQLDYNVLYE